MVLPLYLYTGPEFGQRDDAVTAVKNSLKKKFGEFEEHIYYLNETSFPQALSSLENGNLFASATCVICKNAELIKKKEDLRLLEDWIKTVTDTNEDSSVLILISDDISVDSKLDKLVPAQNKKKFWEMYEDKKIPWLLDYFRNNGYGLETDAAQLILDMVENNTQSLKSECNRFFLVLEKGKTVTADDVESLLTHNREETAFTLFNQIANPATPAEKRFEEGLEILQAIRLSKDNSSVMIIAGLSSCFRKLVIWHKLHNDGGYGPDEATLKSNGFSGKLMQAQYRKAAKIWTIGQATAILAILASTDMQIRSGGNLMEDVLLQKMLFEITMKKGGTISTADYD